MSTPEADSATNDLQREAAIEQFRNVTGTTEETARATLEAWNWNLELAINMHVDSIDEPIDVTPQSSSSSAAASASAAPSSSSAALSTDHVRPPIPPVRQVLVEDDYSTSYSRHHRRTQHSVFDAFRDFQAEARWQEQHGSNTGEEEENGAESVGNTKKRTLQDLFRPPLELLFHGTFEQARNEGMTKNKWLMVNVQNVQEFSCQVLNRDVWSNSTVKDIVSEHFVFWQIYSDSAEGERYMQYYNVHEFPHVGIIDPVTGEKLQQWTSVDPLTFCEMITGFLMDRPSPNGGKNGVSGSSQPTTSGLAAIASGSGRPIKSHKVSEEHRNVYEQSEEDQLKAAIAASLKDAVTRSCAADIDVDVDDNSDYNPFESDDEDGNVKTNGEELENWKDYIAEDSGKVSELVIRFPDGSREQKSFPAESKLKALLLYVASKGFSGKEYDLVTNFPRRNLKDVPSTSTLVEANLFPRETVFVQHSS